MRHASHKTAQGDASQRLTSATLARLRQRSSRKRAALALGAALVCGVLAWCTVVCAQGADPNLFDPAASLRLSYLRAYRSVALALHGLTAAFISLRLGWNWRQESVPDAMLRALPSGIGYAAVSMAATLVIWTPLDAQTPLTRINLALMLSFLIGTALGSPLAWWLSNRARASAPAPIDMDAEIQRRLALLRTQAQREQAQVGGDAQPGEDTIHDDTTPTLTTAPPEDPSTSEAP